MTGPTRLWILEDDPAIRSLYEATFAAAAAMPYELTFFSSLRAFLDATADGGRADPDLIISDLCLPDGNFADVFPSATVFAARTGRSAPVVVASGWTDLEPIRRLLAAGVADFITKPFPPAEVLAKVERHLGRVDGGAKASSFSIDPRTLTITAGNGRSVSLTSKQFQIMILLCNNPGRPVPRDEIVKRVWDQVNVSSKNMNVHFSMLRQKLKPLGIGVLFVLPHHYLLDVGAGEGAGDGIAADKAS